ncbi:MAG: dockerin type I repeat-containing protein, partial [Planctomycetota bacterium]|nr:dockerin type I repeat-containing protein [Planctomycetota bacterium]
DLGIADDDIWAYVSAPDPTESLELNAWGSFGQDLNPEGFPGPFPGANFYSHIFVAWDLPADLPLDFGWGGATVTVTLASDTYTPEAGDVYIRFLNRGFREFSWSIFGNTPVPVPSLGRITGDDSGATGAETQVTFTLPPDLNPDIWRQWVKDGQIYLAITNDIAPPPPGDPGEPQDLTGVLQVHSSEDILGRGPTISLLNEPRILGDINGDGAVNAGDLGTLLGSWLSDNFFSDLNGDGVVNAADLGILLGAWTG